ncbi:MAG: trypsin-like serine protease [Sandaracinaceae bacterium]|nr:trypsin-like serine protease [Sandaracinaceae bacterium]
MVTPHILARWSRGGAKRGRSSGDAWRWLGVAAAILALGCQGGIESLEVEDFDADRGLRSLKHERGLDFGWVNTRMPHVVLVSIPLRAPTTLATANSCTGVLVAPDLVLTAGHCLKDTAYLADDCTVVREPGGRGGHIRLDQQIVQDSGVGFPPPADRDRPSRRIEIRELVAHPGRNLFLREPVLGDPVREVCTTPTQNRHFDGASALRSRCPSAGSRECG